MPLSAVAEEIMSRLAGARRRALGGVSEIATRGKRCRRISGMLKFRSAPESFSVRSSAGRGNPVSTQETSNSRVAP